MEEERLQKEKQGLIIDLLLMDGLQRIDGTTNGRFFCRFIMLEICYSHDYLIAAIVSYYSFAIYQLIADFMPDDDQRFYIENISTSYGYLNVKDLLFYHLRNCIF